MIYLDTSVVLARLFAEPRSPTDDFWSLTFTSSRLLEYEVMNRLHARVPSSVLLEDASDMLDKFILLELSPEILSRAMLPFPAQVGTLDGLHLATMVYLRRNSQTIELATYDQRLAQGAMALGFSLTTL